MVFPQDMPTLRAACESNNGCVRKHNEDNFCCAALPSGYLFAAVADGVGGHGGGEIASYLCSHRLLLDWKEMFRQDAAPDDAAVSGFLAKSVCAANSDITHLNAEQHRRYPMCTTVVAAVFTPRMVISAHVGDSRLYCSRNGTLHQLTTDHTLLNEWREKNGCQHPESEPPAHILCQAVGLHDRVKPEIHSFFRSPGDRFLLCSDGLTTCLSDPEIQTVLDRSDSPREATDVLIRTTIRRGASDNVTVICAFPQA